MADETPETMEIVHLLDSHLSERGQDAVSTIVVKKYSFSFYSRAAPLVREFYAAGNRFEPNGWGRARRSTGAMGEAATTTGAGREAREAMKAAVAGEEGGSSSPASSVASCGMRLAGRNRSSPATSDGPMELEDDDADEDLEMGVDCDAKVVDGEGMEDEEEEEEDDDMTLAEVSTREAEEEVVLVEEEVVFGGGRRAGKVDEWSAAAGGGAGATVQEGGRENDEPFRYAMSCAGQGVAVEGNLRERDRRALRQMMDGQNVVPMSV